MPTTSTAAISTSKAEALVQSSMPIDGRKKRDKSSWSVSPYVPIRLEPALPVFRLFFFMIMIPLISIGYYDPRGVVIVARWIFSTFHH